MEGGCHKAPWLLFETLGISEETEAGNRTFGGRGGSTAVGNHHAVEVTEELGHLNNDRLCSRALR